VSQSPNPHGAPFSTTNLNLSKSSSIHVNTAVVDIGLGVSLSLGLHRDTEHKEVMGIWNRDNSIGIRWSSRLTGCLMRIGKKTIALVIGTVRIDKLLNDREREFNLGEGA